MITYRLSPLCRLETTVGEFRQLPDVARGAGRSPTSVVFPCDESEPVELDDSCPLVLHQVLETAGQIAFRLIEAEPVPRQPIYSVAVYGWTQGQPVRSSSGERGIMIKPLHPREWFFTSVEVTQKLIDYLADEQGYGEDQAAQIAVKMINDRLVFINSYVWMRHEMEVLILGEKSILD